MITIVGQCYGANEKEQARHYAKVLIFLDYAMLSVICTVMILGRHFFVTRFNLSPEAVPLAAGLVLIHSIAMIIWPLAFLPAYYFRAIGRAAFTMVTAVFSMWVFRIGLAHIFIRILHMNVLGVWYAMFVDWIFRVIVFLAAFRKKE